MNTVLESKIVPVPLLQVLVSCGFPSPASAYSAAPLVIDDWLWPARASCQLAPWGPDSRCYLVLDRAFSPRAGDRLWWPGCEELGRWPQIPAGLEASTEVCVVVARIRLFRLRPDPGPTPESVHDWLVRRPFATYLVRASGRSMLDFDIEGGSLLVVDRSARHCDRDLVIAGTDQGFLVKQYRSAPPRLVAGNPNYPDIVLSRAPQFQLDGVVIASLTRWRGAQ